MVAKRVYADVRVRHNVGRVALMRGPIVYCLEQKDNGPDLNALVLPPKSKIGEKKSKSLGGVVTLHARAAREMSRRSSLYVTSRPTRKQTSITAIPYYAWANRGVGEMLVWMREAVG
jgi:uncharacterized protein